MLVAAGRVHVGYFEVVFFVVLRSRVEVVRKSGVSLTRFAVVAINRKNKAGKRGGGRSCLDECEISFLLIQSNKGIPGLFSINL
jgi:hypothetical protein